MQFKVDVDCTPEEARAFLGLPDLAPVHARYIEIITEAMNGQMSMEQMDQTMRSLSPFGDAGLKMFSNMMNIGMNAAGPPKDKS